MPMKQLTFDYSPAWLLVCLLVGLAYAWMLYSQRNGWSVWINRMLFGLRWILVFVLSMFLLGPLLRQTLRSFEKPVIAVLVDNSRSVGHAIDSAQLRVVENQINTMADNARSLGFQLDVIGLSGDEPYQFSGPQSDLAGGLREIQERYEDSNLAHVLILSDGLYNAGISPLYTPTRVPVSAIGVGDTIQHPDIIIKSLSYNKIAYEGNRFPLRAELAIHHLPDKDIAVSVAVNGKIVDTQKQNAGKKTFLTFDFKLEAAAQGFLKLDVQTAPDSQESNLKNNHASAFVEVVAGKKKILIVSSSPHPDIKALRAAIEKNPNYECLLHIPGVKELPAGTLNNLNVDLIIFHQSPDVTGKTNELFRTLSAKKIPYWVILGKQSPIRSLSQMGVPVQYESYGQWDEVFGVANSAESMMGLSEDFNAMAGRVPPLHSPFGKFSFPSQSHVVLWQRIGNVPTNRPLLWFREEEGIRVGYLMAEGIWSWRLHENAITGKSTGTDELIAKTVQYLSTRNDRRRFRVFPVADEFSDAEPVVFESQVFNAVYEPVFGNQIELSVLSDNGKKSDYSFTTSPGSVRYPVSGLPQGIYQYTATSTVEGKQERTSGRFLVREQDLESRNLTADFGLLRQLARQSGGFFCLYSDWNQVKQSVEKIKPVQVIHAEETVDPLINLKWAFFLLLGLITIEWLTRKWLGNY